MKAVKREEKVKKEVENGRMGKEEMKEIRRKEEKLGDKK